MSGFLDDDEEAFGVEAEEELDLVLECHEEDKDDEVALL